MDSNPLQSYRLGHYYCDEPHHALLHSAISISPVGGIGLDFGVGSGLSTRCIASWMPTIGFDSFQGLPEDWREEFPAGSFRWDHPGEIENATIVEGLFEDTLHRYLGVGMRPIALIHIDCDLYSSTKTVLENLPVQNLVSSKTVIVFDEWWGYPGCEEHEQKAWREFAERTGIHWEVIGHGVQQWGIRIL